jgi:hypothetical protein
LPKPLTSTGTCPSLSVCTFSKTLNTLSAFLQHCDRSVSHCFQYRVNVSLMDELFFPPKIVKVPLVFLKFQKKKFILMNI